MLDKQDYYHGAALIAVINSRHFKSVRKMAPGYVVNDGIFVFIKYTTRNRSPWTFTFTSNDIKILKSVGKEFKQIHIALVCGGDGICAVTWTELFALVNEKGGSVSVSRKFHKQYNVKGSLGSLSNKISFKRWAEIS